MDPKNKQVGDGQEGQTGSSSTAPAFDQVEFNRNLQATLSTRDQQLTQTILNAVSSMNQGQNRAAADIDKSQLPDELMQEVSAEAEVLGMDENATKSLISLATKVFNKKAPGIKDETKGELRGELSAEEQKKSFNNDALARYPQALDESSALRQQARIEYQSMDPALLKSPRATSIAIEAAARKLGIQPLSLEQVRGRDAQTESGNGGGNKKVETGATKEQVDFAMGFQVKESSFKKHLANIQRRDNSVNR